MARSDKIELDEKDLKHLEGMAGLGLPVEKMAAIIGMSKATLERRIAENGGNNQVNEALLKGRSVASNNVRKTAYEMAVSGKHPTMTIFWLKCREGFMDNQADFEEEEEHVA